MTLFRMLELIRTAELINRVTLTKERINEFLTKAPEKIIEVEDLQGQLFYVYKAELERVLGSSIDISSATKILMNHYFWAVENRQKIRSKEDIEKSKSRVTSRNKSLRDFIDETI